MKDRRMLIIGGLAAVLLIAIPLTVYIANQQQDVRSRADEGTFIASNVPTNTPTPLPTSTPVPSPSVSPTIAPTTAPSPTVTPPAGATTTPAASGTITPSPTGGACQAPEVVSGVTFDYPSCTGTQCNFTQASCTWAAVNGATSYDIKITQVDSGTITSTTSVTAPSVTYSFDVEQGKTYRCEITARNACGTSAAAGSAEALCAVDGQVTTPTQVPQPTTPRVIPTLPPTGDVSTTALVGIGGVIITILGGLLFFFSGM